MVFKRSESDNDQFTTRFSRFTVSQLKKRMESPIFELFLKYDIVGLLYPKALGKRGDY